MFYLHYLLELSFYSFYIVADDVHANATTKSRGVTGSHSSHSPAKAQAHTDGKKSKHDRSESHGKGSAHGTTKKSDGHKSQTNKPNKTKNDKTDQEKNGNTDTVI
ncbi:unnamed protein product [Rotaria sordida]|uniref:Uncharacterized protein n=1 Tax=Rotaria sordida TaxID=392033 RepID=A0A819DRL4_9BILA|nr:unnamed protein product [Rotaria sordida]